MKFNFKILKFKKKKSASEYSKLEHLIIVQKSKNLKITLIFLQIVFCYDLVN